jgi:hypothetical protein
MIAQQARGTALEVGRMALDDDWLSEPTVHWTGDSDLAVENDHSFEQLSTCFRQVSLLI